MISKKIHYCWFGPKCIPQRELDCIESWKKYLPDYELVFWNEDNFDVNSVEFCQQAYKSGYYAFVSDYVRAYALYNYGGIYLDTDVEVFEGFKQEIEKNSATLGFENKTMIGTAMMAFSERHCIPAALVEYYEKNQFLLANGTFNKTANPFILTEHLKSLGLIQNNSFQRVNGVKIYPRDYFFPKLLEDDVFALTNNTLSVHKFSASWLTDREKKRGRNKLWLNVARPILKNCQKLLNILLGSRLTKSIELTIRKALK